MERKNYFKGKEYNFKMGVIADELADECRALLKEYCRILVEYEEIPTNSVGHSIGTGKRDIDDELLFESAITHYTEYLRNQIKERNKHIIVVKEGNIDENY